MKSSRADHFGRSLPLNRLTEVVENYQSGQPADHQTNVSTAFDYDALGNLISITDPLDHVSTFAYDDLNRLTSRKDPLLNETIYDYDALGNLTEVRDAKAQITRYDYDPLNRLTDVTRPDEIVNFTYNAVGNRLTMSDNTGTTNYDYDDLDRLVEVADPLNQVVQYGYDPVGNRASLTYPDLSEVVYTYDPANRLTIVEDWDSGLTTYSYDDAGQLVEMALPNGITSTYTYDDAGQLTLLLHQAVSGTLSSYGYSYDDVGNRIQAVETVATPVLLPSAVFTTTPLAGVSPLTVTFTYTTAHATDLTWNFGDGITTSQIITSSLAGGIEGGVISHTYQSAGIYTVTLTAANSDATYILTRSTYIAVIPADAFQEENGQLVLEAENYDHRTSGSGPQMWETADTFTSFAGTGYVQTRPDLGTRYETDALVDASALHFQVSFVTTGTYTLWLRGAAPDAAGDSVIVGLEDNNQNQQLVPVSGFAPRTWDWANTSIITGQPATITVASPGPYNLTIWMREDGLRLDRLILTTNTLTIPTGTGPAESPRAADSSVDFVPPTSITDSSLTSTAGSQLVVYNSQFTTDDSSLASSPPTPPSPFVLAPALMFMGPLAIGAPLARRRRRLAWFIVVLLLALAFVGAGTAIAADMNVTSEQLSISHDQLSVNSKQSTGYRSLNTGLLNPDPLNTGHLSVQTSPLAQTTTATQTTIIDYTYDPLYRLTDAAFSGGGSFAYTYDAAGNRKTYAINGTSVATYTYDIANRLTQVAGGQASVVSYSYDDNGNLLSDGNFTYTYDSANRLIELTDGISTNEYVYNGDGTRVAQIVDGIRTDYVQDVAAPLPQLLASRQGGTVSKYLRGLGLIGEQTGGTGPNAGPAVWQYHLPDALGSVRQIVDPTGQILSTQRFDPFGGLMQQPSAAAGQPSPYGFAGEEQDPTSGQLYLRARTYNPATGRFLQTDPVLGTPNQPRTLHNYAYAFNNPVNYVDPSGQMPPGFGTTAYRRAQAPSQQDRFTSYAASNTRTVHRQYAGSRQLYRGTPPTMQYSKAAPTQGGSFRAWPDQGMQPSHSVNAQAMYRKSSDPYAKEQSQGHRPEACGPTNTGSPSPLDYAFYIRNQARDLGENVVENVQEFAEDPQGTLEDWGEDIAERFKAQRAKMYDDFSSGRIFSAKYWKKGLAPIATVASIGIGMLPVIGSLYDAYSLWLGRDPLTGAPLSKAEMGLIAAGIVGGFIGFGFLDEAGDIGKGIVKGVGSVDEIADAAKSARYVDDVADAAKGLGRVDEVIDVAKNLDNIDEAIDVAKNLDNVDEALDVTRNLDEVEDAVNTAADLSRADELGDTARLSDELDEATVGRTDAPEGSNLGGNCKFNSFTAGTVVQTDEGEKPIEEVALGDKVFAEDPETGEQGFFEVVALTNHPETDILRVVVESEVEDPAAPAAPDQSTVDTTDESADNDYRKDNESQQPNTEISSMEITPEHPVYVEDKGWLNAENLAEGDRLRRADGGYATVLAVERVELDEPQEVYNFTVKGPHTYFVLSSGVLVHNVDCFPYTKPDVNKKPFQSDADLDEVAERQQRFWEKRAHHNIDENGEPSRIPFDQSDWDCYECGPNSRFFQKEFGDYELHIKNDGDVYIDGKSVGNAGHHFASVDESGRVWDPSTNTWGQNVLDYLNRVDSKGTTPRTAYLIGGGNTAEAATPTKAVEQIAELSRKYPNVKVVDKAEGTLISAQTGLEKAYPDISNVEFIHKDAFELDELSNTHIFVVAPNGNLLDETPQLAQKILGPNSDMWVAHNFPLRSRNLVNNLRKRGLSASNPIGFPKEGIRVGPEGVLINSSFFSAGEKANRIVTVTR